MKIAVFEVEHWEREAFKELGSEHEVRFSNKPLRASNANLYASAEVLSPFIYSDLSSTVLQQFKHLKLIATRSTGFDHIDIGYCQKRGITVCNVPVYGENAVAEHVFALLLPSLCPTPLEHSEGATFVPYVLFQVSSLSIVSVSITAVRSGYSKGNR